MRIGESNARFGQMMKNNIHYQHAVKQIRDTLTIQFGFDVWKLPVCEKCEGYALWHQQEGRKVGACKCGHITKNPITVQEYYEKGYAIDKTGFGRDTPVVVDRNFVQPKDVGTIYRGDAGLDNPDKKIIIAR